jgi:hypothetical protein
MGDFLYVSLKVPIRFTLLPEKLTEVVQTGLQAHKIKHTSL